MATLQIQDAFEPYYAGRDGLENPAPAVVMDALPTTPPSGIAEDRKARFETLRRRLASRRAVLKGI